MSSENIHLMPIEMNARELLSKCYMAVDSQRAGLQKGIIGQGFLNIKS